MPGLRRGAGIAGDQAPGRLHDAALLALGGPHHPREPRLRRAHVRHEETARRPDGALDAWDLEKRGNISSPARSPAAGSSAWRSRPACCTARSSCSSTSPPPASTPRHGATSGRRSTRLAGRASRCSCRRTTWTRPSAATGSPTSPTASCSPTARRRDPAPARSPPGRSADRRAGCRAGAEAAGRAGVVARHRVRQHAARHRRGRGRAGAGDPAVRARSRSSSGKGRPSLEDVFIHLMQAPRTTSNDGERFLVQRWLGIIVKEFIQLRRDRLTFGMIIGIPVLQLILFGYAINSDPKRLPTAVLSADSSPYSRALLAALQTSGYFRIDRQVANEDELERLLALGQVRSPSPSRRASAASWCAASAGAAGRGRRHRPAAIGNASSALSARVVVLPARPERRAGPRSRRSAAVEMRVHRRYNPEGITAYNIVPGLIGTILTMTMVLMTGAGDDARARARDLREPARHAGAADRGDDRQDRALHPDRLRSRWRSSCCGAAGCSTCRCRGALRCSYWWPAAVHRRQPDRRLSRSRRSPATRCRRCR